MVIVVEDISRAVDSEFLARFLADHQRKGRSDQKVIVVLSKSERNIKIKNRVNTAFDEEERAVLADLARRGEEARVESRRLKENQEDLENNTREIQLSN
jgi:hypothetical protein